MIRDSVLEILNDPEKWLHFSLSGYKYAHDNFRISTTGEKYLALLKKTLAILK